MEKIRKYLWMLMIVPITIVTIQHFKIRKLNKEIQLKNVEIATYQDSVSTYITKNGELISQIESVEVEKRNLKESLEIAGYDIKQLKEDNIRWRKLNNVLKLELEAMDSASITLHDTTIITETDTIKFMTLEPWTNDYLSILNGEIKDKRLSFDYIYRTNIDIFQTSTRKSTIVSVKLSDPKAKIISGNSITIEHKTKWYEKWYVWGIAGFAGGVFLMK